MQRAREPSPETRGPSLAREAMAAGRSAVPYQLMTVPEKIRFQLQQLWRRL